MKKHLLGTLIFLIAFIVSFLASPIHFTSFAGGSGYNFSFTSYESTYFVKLSLSGETYETAEETKEAFESRINLYSEEIEKQEILKLEENRAIITFQSKIYGQGSCAIRKEKIMLYHICSTSLRHVLEFEKQKFPEN